MTSIFVDTSALLTLLDRDDQDHGSVVKALGTLSLSETTLITSSHVLVEAGSLVRSRLGTSAFRLLGEILESSVEIVWVDEELHRRAWKEASTGGERAPGLVDWVSFPSDGRTGYYGPPSPGIATSSDRVSRFFRIHEDRLAKRRMTDESGADRRLSRLAGVWRGCRRTLPRRPSPNPWTSAPGWSFSSTAT